MKELSGMQNAKMVLEHDEMLGGVDSKNRGF